MTSRKDVLVLDHVSAKYDGTLALDDISLRVAEHDLLGIIGPNGGGKSTLLKVILGLLAPSKGEVLVFGEPPEKSRNRIGYVPQYSHFDLDFPVSVRDVTMMGRYGARGMLTRYNRADRDIADRVLKRVDMLDHADTQIGNLSGGQQQRVMIARALAAEPSLLLLDEPMASVDSAMQTSFYELLEDLKSEMAIIMVSHDIGAVSVFVDIIACLNVRLYYHGSKEITPEILEATYKCPVQLITHGEVPHRVLREH